MYSGRKCSIFAYNGSILQSPSFDYFSMVKASLAEASPGERFQSKNCNRLSVSEDDNNEDDEAFTFAKVHFTPQWTAKIQHKWQFPCKGCRIRKVALSNKNSAKIRTNNQFLLTKAPSR